MPLIPLFVGHNPLSADSEAGRLSAFNWCNSFDTILPFADGVIDSTDRAHLWGLYSGIEVSLDNRFSAFNWCSPFDTILPFSDGMIDSTDRAHLWGSYSGIEVSEDTIALRFSAFNWCNPFDTILPFSDGVIDRTDRAHLWGLYSGIAVRKATQGSMLAAKHVRRRMNRRSWR